MIRLLIADDSPVFRHFLKQCIAEMDGVELVGEARNGEDALAKIAALKPDAITLDMSMPRLSGMQVLREMRKKHTAMKAIVLTSGSEGEAGLTVEALDAGAFDFILKPDASVVDAKGFMIEALFPRLKAISRSLASRRVKLSGISEKSVVHSKTFTARSLPDVIAIGSSTGGPEALNTVLSALPGSLNVPIVLTQHMPTLFLKSLAERLERETALTCALAEEGAVLSGGHIYIAPGETHLELSRQGQNVMCHLVDKPPVHHCRPAVDPMFFSLATLAPRIRTFAIVLTGMGEDGAAGAKAISDAKGYVIAQNQQSSVVWGMPGATVACGAAQEVLSLIEIAPAIVAMCGGKVSTRDGAETGENVGASVGGNEGGYASSAI